MGAPLVVVIYIISSLCIAFISGTLVTAIRDLRAVHALKLNGSKLLYARASVVTQAIYFLISAYVYLVAFFIVYLERVPMSSDGIQRFITYAVVAALVTLASLVQFVVSAKLRS